MSKLVSDVLTYAETKAQVTAGTLNNATVGLPFMNDALVDYRADLIDQGIDASQVQEAYVPSVSLPPAGQGSTFAFPSDMFKLKTIEVNFTDTNEQNYVTVDDIEISNTPFNISFDFLRTNQPMAAPLFDNRGDTYEIFPAWRTGFNLVNPIKMFYFLAPSPYVTTADVLVYPDTLDYYVLSYKVAELYYESLLKFNEAEIWQKRYMGRLMRLVRILTRASQSGIQSKNVPLSGWEF